jgi:teichuronic acid biosynthesis glycosyltransferase TuaC
MRRLALVTPLLPVPGDPTRGRFMYETARALSKVASVRVFLQHPRYPTLRGLVPRRFRYAQACADYAIDGLDIEALDYPAVPIASRALNGWVSGHVLLPRLRRYAPDVVLAYWVYPDGYGALYAARRLRVPCVVGALGSDIHVRSGIGAWLTRRTIERVDALVTVSEAMRRSAIADFGADPSRVETIVNGFNASVFRPLPRAAARAALGVPPDAELIVYVGRLVQAKGLRELVDAVARVAPRRPGLAAVLVGEGPMREELSRAIAAGGLSDCIRLTGGLPPDQVASWLAASDLLTLPSWSEGYPNVVVEALACGRPVVASDVGGVREIVSEHNGLLVPARDPAALARAFEQALARIWNHAAIAESMRRSWDDVARETLAVCERVLGRHDRVAAT